MCFAVVGRVTAVPEPQVAEVAFDGGTRRISLVLLAAEGVSVVPGDWLRTHTGLAIEVIDEGRARGMRLLEGAG